MHVSMEHIIERLIKLIEELIKKFFPDLVDDIDVKQVIV
jgi:hypothetical protein